MKIVNLIDEDFSNYKIPSMFIGFPHCTLKCDKECGECICQNSELLTSKRIDISYKDIIKRYMDNNITHAIVMGGLEPFDSFYDLDNLISEFRKQTHDTIIIYTGYYPKEIIVKLYVLKSCYHNIIIKFGRMIPHKETKFDELLGVTLASDNQYSERIS